MTSYRYFPSTGGIQTISRVLAREFSRQGHQVRIITSTPQGSDRVDDCNVYRCPNVAELIKLHLWADVVFHNNITLTWAWPLLLIKKPFVSAAHVNVAPGSNDPLGILSAIKIRLLQKCPVIVPSSYLALNEPYEATVVPNAYDPTIFYMNSEFEPKEKYRIAFVGRIVSEKGLHILLRALAECMDSPFPFILDVVGDGPERSASEALAKKLHLENSVIFHGSLPATKVAHILRKAEFQVIPSTWNEPFGVVALEGIACGCQVIYSDIGGLPEATGSVGWPFKTGSYRALRDVLLGLANSSNTFHPASDLATHVAPFTPSRMAEGYLQVIQKAASKRKN